MDIATVGLDLAKHWFQVHAVDALGQTVARRKLRRGEVLGYFKALTPCLVGMEACATAHHWTRELTALGHEAHVFVVNDKTRATRIATGHPGPESPLPVP